MAFRIALLVLMLVVAGASWAGLMIALIAHAITHPPRMTDARAIIRLKRLSPDDLGIDFEDVEFYVLDARSNTKLKIAGWWMPASPPSVKTAVLLHGYADAKVGAVACAPVLLTNGLNVLAIDSRAHGDSGGPACTAGYFERADVSQVIDELLATRPEQTRQIILFGASMGAATAAAVAVDRTDIAATILDSPYGDFRDALAVRAHQRGLPTGLLLKAAGRLAERLSGARFDRVRPVDLIATLRCPLLTILPGADILLNAGQRFQLTQAAANGPSPCGPRDVYAPADVAHLQAQTANPDEYADRVGRFLTEALAVPDTVRA